MNATSAIRVAIVDDQTLIRAGLAMVIDSQPDLTMVAEAADGAEAIAVLADAEVDVVLMDIRMPGTDGIAATDALVRAWESREESPRVVVLTTFDLDEYVLDAIKAGASGFLLKDTPPEEMLAAIRTVHRGDAVLAPSTTRRLMARISQDRPAPGPSVDTDGRLEALTDREREVFVLIAHGLSNGEISERLVVAEATVKTHVGRILAKTGARDRVQAVVLAYESGLVVPGEPT